MIEEYFYYSILENKRIKDVNKLWSGGKVMLTHKFLGRYLVSLS